MQWRGFWITGEEGTWGPSERAAREGAPSGADRGGVRHELGLRGDCRNPEANMDSEEVASSNFHATIKYSIVMAQLNGMA